jgi:hypothetical protein
MKLYEFIAIIVIPITLFYFIIDYLSDNNITKDETKVGILQLIHHFLVSMVFTTPLVSLFLLKDLKYTALSIIIILIIQGGFLINKERCWLSRMVNRMTNSSVDRKWISDINSYIKYYIRGSEWANGDVHPDFNYKYTMPLVNMLYIITLIKFIY